jgi:predicted glycoside hydrolase/deacetylase ChbG (UPF0249 family)
MPARLIVNADDFGLTRGVNRAIRELHERGILTSATLMANGNAFDDAVKIALTHPTLGVGCHIVLTDGVPVSHPESIPTLLAPDGKNFRPKLSDFVSALLLGRISEEEIAIEAIAQIQKIERTGIEVTHLDTHKHTHLFPQVARPLLRIAGNGAIGAIRNPFEPAWAQGLGHGSFMRNLQVALLGGFRKNFFDRPQIRTAAVHTTGGSIGVSATGKLNAESLSRILDTMPDGVWELVCHPGYNDADLQAVVTRLRHHRDIERDALHVEVTRRLAQPNPPELIHYGSLKQDRPVA